MAFDLGSAVGYLDLDTSKFQTGLQSALAQLKVFQDKTATTSQQWTALGKAMTTVGGGLTKGLTLPLIGIGTAATAVGNNFEAQMDRVQGTLQETDENMQALRDQAIQLGADTAFSATEAAEGMENLASAGFTTEEIMAAMPGLLDMAAASGASLGDASAYAASTLNAFQLEASEAGHVADVYALAAARTNAQTEDMGEAMKYIGPVANSMGQSLESTAAAIGIMSNAGILGSQAGITLRSALSRMAKPTDVMTEKMTELGITFYDSQGNMKGYSQIISELQTAFVGLTKEEQDNALVTLFGQEALSGMQALIQAGPEQLDELTAALENSDGAAADMAETMMGNTKSAIEQMFGAFESAAIVLQEKLSPYIIKVANTVGDLATKFSQLDDSTLELIVTIGGIVAALGPMLLIFGNIAKAIGTVTTVLTNLGGLSGIVSTFGSAVSGVFTALTGPIGIAIAVVAALFVAWQTDFNGMRDTVSSVFSSIQSIISSAITIIQSIVGLALGLLTAAWQSNFANIQGIVTAVFNTIQTTIQNVLAVIQSIFDIWAAVFTGDWQGVWEGIKSLFINFWTTIAEFLMNALNLLVQILIGSAGLFLDAGMALFTTLKNAFISGWQAITSWWSGAVQDPVGTILGIGQALYNAGASIFNELWNGLKSVWDGIVGWVSDSINWLVDKVTFWEDESAKVSSGNDARSSRMTTEGSYASGLDYVPRDMNVRVHEGERILTKEENKARNSNLATGNTFVFNSPEAIDAITAAREFRKTSRKLAEGLI